MASPVSSEADPLADALREEKVRAVYARLQTFAATRGDDVGDDVILHFVDQLRSLGLDEWAAVEMLGEALPGTVAPRVERIAAIAFGMTGISDAPAQGPAWLCPPILAKGHVGLLIGPWGGGKSNLLAATAIAASSGGEFFGRSFVEAVGALILSGEAGDEVPPRLRALAADAGLNPDAIPVLSASCRDHRDIELHIETAVLRIRREFRIKLGMVALDNLQSIFAPQDEEDPSFAWAKMQELRRLAEWFGASVMVAHHTGKRDAGPRGSQAWGDAANFILRIDAEQDRRTGHFRRRKLRLTKTRHGPPLDLGGFAIVDSPNGTVLRFGEEPRPAEDPSEPTGRRRTPVQTRRGHRAISTDERILTALGAAGGAGESIEVEGLSCATIDVAARHYNAGRPEPSRWRNLTRSVLAAACRAGVRRIDREGVTYLEIPSAP